MTTPPGLESAVETYQLPTASARALNALESAPGNRRRVRWLMDRCSVDVEAIEKLFQRALVDTQDANGNYVDIYIASNALVGAVYVKLTAAGQKWVDWNPGNRTLRVLASTPRRRTVTVQKLMTRADAGEPLIRQLRDTGFIEVLDATDWPVSGLVDAFRRPREFKVILTNHGRGVVRV